MNYILKIKSLIILCCFMSSLQSQVVVYHFSFDKDPIENGWQFESIEVIKSMYDWKWNAYNNCLSSGSLFDYPENEYVAISPELKITNNLIMSFDYIKQFSDDFHVYLVDAKRRKCFTSIDSFAIDLFGNLPVSLKYRTMVYDLSPFEGKSIHLIFVHRKIKHFVCVDNLTIHHSNANLLSQFPKLHHLKNRSVELVENPLVKSVPYYEDFSSYGKGSNSTCGILFYSSDTVKLANEYIHSIRWTDLSRLSDLPITVEHGQTIILPTFDVPIEDLELKISFSTFFPINMLFGCTDDVLDYSSIEFVDKKYTQLSSVKRHHWDDSYCVYFKNISYKGLGHSIVIHIPPLKNVFKHSSSFTINSIAVNFVPQCVRPLNLTYKNRKEDALDVEWVNCNNDVKNYTVEYSDNDSNIVVKKVDTTYCVLNHLKDNTEYSIRVRANCNDVDSSEYSSKLIVNTKCKPIRFSRKDSVYIDSFEAGLKTRWRKLKVSTHSFQLVNDSTYYDGYNDYNARPVMREWIVGDAYSKSGCFSLYPSLLRANHRKKHASSNVSHLYVGREIIFNESGKYRISYEWYGNGSNNAFAKAFCIPSNFMFANEYTLSCDENEEVLSLLSHHESLQKSKKQLWEPEGADIYITKPGKYFILFYWYNNLSAPKDEIVVIDDFKIEVVSD